MSVSCLVSLVVEAVEDGVERLVHLLEPDADVGLDVEDGRLEVVLLHIGVRHGPHVRVQLVDGVVDTAQDITSEQPGSANGDVEQHLVIHVTSPRHGVTVVLVHLIGRRNHASTNAGFNGAVPARGSANRRSQSGADSLTAACTAQGRL
jgi:hypothetical protein